MSSIVLPSYNKNILRAILSLKLADRTLPELGDDDVLIKTYAASCNPSDIAFIQGGYNIVKKLPAVPGFEGSGTVVDAGKRMKNLIGKKVSCFIQDDIDGTWADYFIGHRDNILVLDKAMDMDQAACFSVNPFTAYALMQIAQLRESQAIIQNAAGGQVAAFIRQIAKINGIEVINIVRKQNTAETLFAEGSRHVLVEQDDDFQIKLQHLAHQLYATTAFDAVGGPNSGIIFNAMPNDSELVAYGGLSNKMITEIDTMGLIFNDKIISGFNLVDWKSEIETDDFNVISNELQQMFIEGILHTKIQSIVNFKDIVQGLKMYLGNMSNGKILLKP